MENELDEKESVKHRGKLQVSGGKAMYLILPVLCAHSQDLKIDCCGV